MRIQGLLGRPEGSGKQWWPLAIVPRPMVATDRMMMSDCTTVPDHGIEGGRLDGVPLRDQLAMPPSGTWERFESFHDKVKAATERAILEATGQTGQVT